jgi:MoxR-like ATPase
VLTSNATRELSDALRRRCLYPYVDFPDVDREVAILHARLPALGIALAGQVARLVAALRREQLRKVPGVAEILDWAAALLGLGVHELQSNPEALFETLVCVLKTHEDRAAVDRAVLARLAANVA